MPKIREKFAPVAKTAREALNREQCDYCQCDDEDCLLAIERDGGWRLLCDDRAHCGLEKRGHA
jgi:hypothetical protein